MSIDLIALSSLSGLPLFTRRVNLNIDTTARCEDSEFSNGIALNTITTLYGLNLFSRLNDCDLQLAKSSTGTSKIRWKLFNKNIVMILVTNNVDFLEQNDLEVLLELTFDAIVIMCGLTDISDTNVERFKRNTKSSYPLIDYFLKSFSLNNLRRLELITKSTNYALTIRSSYITSLVNSVAQLASSNYSALFIHRKLLSASKDWWSRLNNTKDSFLISCLLNSLDTDLINTKEVLIHLPCISPTCLTRLVISQITKGVVLCILCAEYPSLEQIESEIIVPLNDLKLQEEKLSRYIYELRETKFISQATFSELLGKHASVLNDLSAFIVFRFDQNIYFAFNEDLIEQYSQEIITLCQLDQSEKITFSDSFLICDKINMYQMSNKSLLVCVLFECNNSVRQMNLLTTTLVEAFSKSKHFWP